MGSDGDWETALKNACSGLDSLGIGTEAAKNKLKELAW
uniref:Uncharacterized protein n=1 Tax=Siphoviridae sp. ctWhx86 TaxID=2826362 RepID=A0A8S5QNI2_9CAUD|nr:MAG TPA: hypothetical protein [Siphoviridae sp. ctWhx86]